MTKRVKFDQHRRVSSRITKVVALLLALAVVAAACGSSEDSSAPVTTDPAVSESDPPETDDTAPAEETPTSEDPPEVAAGEISDGSGSGPNGLGTVDDIQPISNFCGDQDVTIGYVDSWASVNAWRKVTKAELLDEAAGCPGIVEVISTDGEGTLEKTISDIQGLIAQDVDGIVVMMADFGAGLLPVMRQAMDAGIPITGFLAFGLDEGVAGVDYVAIVNADEVYDGEQRALWLIDQMGGEGNILDVGGTPGNPLSSAVYQGVQNAADSDDDVTLLNDAPIDTNFNPADAQTGVAGALVQFDDIDGVQAECGTCSPGGFQAFILAERPLVPWSSDDNNELACLFYELKETNPGFELQTSAARNWLSRVALHKTLAAVQGLANDEPSIFTMPIVEDSTDPDLQPVCVPDAPAGAIWSALMTDAEIIEAVS